MKIVWSNTAQNLVITSSNVFPALSYSCCVAKELSSSSRRTLVKWKCGRTSDLPRKLAIGPKCAGTFSTCSEQYTHACHDANMKAHTAVTATTTGAPGAVDVCNRSARRRAGCDRRKLALRSKPFIAAYCARNWAFSFATCRSEKGRAGCRSVSISLVRVADSKMVMESELRSMSQSAY